MKDNVFFPFIKNTNGKLISDDIVTVKQTSNLNVLQTFIIEMSRSYGILYPYLVKLNIKEPKEILICERNNKVVLLCEVSDGNIETIQKWFDEPISIGHMLFYHNTIFGWSGCAILKVGKDIENIIAQRIIARS
jgi:hypothetical protein